jgi:cytochrome b561
MPTYNLTTRLLHWLAALLLIAQFSAAIAEIVAGKENVVSQLVGPLHGDIGLIVLGLFAIRLAWKLSGDKTTGSQHNAWVKVGHFALYALMALVPISAVMIKIGAGRGLDLFGIELVSSGEKVAWMLESGKLLHTPLAWLFGALIAGHILMAVYHQFFLKDRAIGRMVKGK